MNLQMLYTMMVTAYCDDGADAGGVGDGAGARGREGGDTNAGVDGGV